MAHPSLITWPVGKASLLTKLIHLAEPSSRADQPRVEASTPHKHKVEGRRLRQALGITIALFVGSGDQPSYQPEPETNFFSGTKTHARAHSVQQRLRSLWTQRRQSKKAID